MTTTIIPTTQSGPDYVPGHCSMREYRQLPALFNDHWLDQMFNSIHQAFDVPNAVYPYNVIASRNDKGEIKHYEIEVALAGVGKENIDVRVRDARLHIDVNKNTDEEPEVEYLRKGISQRKGELTFRLNEKVNSKKITSLYKDGLLRVTIPVVQPETIDIDIKVA